MTIVYDAEAKRATHVESGLSVQFLRWGRTVREQDVYFAVTWKGRTTEFEATYSSGWGKIMKKYPNLSREERRKKVDELNEMEYKTQDIGIDVTSALSDYRDFGDIFVRTWWNAIVNIGDSTASTLVVFQPFFNPADGHWEYRG
jgi:hypothetical protein